jgi:hypothetical protein
MKLAKIVFRVATVWGVLVLFPLYFLADSIGRNDPPPITHPAFYYGFVGVALTWQLVFYIISTDPVRYRPLMIPSILEKLSFAIAVLVMVMQKKAQPTGLVFPGVDMVLGALFAVSYYRTPRT